MSDTYDWFVYINYVNDDNLLGANAKKMNTRFLLLMTTIHWFISSNIKTRQ